MKTGMSLSGDSLLKDIGDHFSKIPDHRDPSRIEIDLKDFFMSGFAIFSLKFPSLLQFEEEMRATGRQSSKLSPLYQIQRVPSDTHFRSVVDEVGSEYLRPLFQKLLTKSQRSGHLGEFQYLDNKYLLSVDGTEYYSSDEVECSSCMVRNVGKEGEPQYYHQMLCGSIVHPEKRTVIPVCPEPILRQDGHDKNDCERVAIRRFLDHFRSAHPKLGVILLADALQSTGPLIRDLERYDMNYIMGVKPGSHEKLFEAMDKPENQTRISYFEIKEELGQKVKKKRTHKFKYSNGVLLNHSNVTTTVNFLEYWETTTWTGKRGKAKEEKVHFSWVTDITITHHNVMQIMRGGRARWKIENETFNTLKNKGYEFEHNFGHGHKNLSTNMIYLMFLAFLFDQLQEIGCRVFQKVLQVVKRKKYLWEKVKMRYEVYSEMGVEIKSWSEFLIKIAGGPPAFNSDP